MKKKLKKLALWVIGGLFIPTLFSYYIGQWLQGSIEIKYFPTSDNYYRNVNVIDEKLRFQATQLEYDGVPYDSLYILKYLLMNDDSQHLPEGAKFFFRVNKEYIIPKKAVVDIALKSISPINEPILLDESYNNQVGPGFMIQTDLPSGAGVIANLILNAKFVDLHDAEVSIVKTPKARERLRLITSPATSKITMSALHFYIWIISIALCYAIAWLIVNILTGNYSTGARILDWIIQGLFKRSILRNNSRQ
jgi:hypothetical protein